MDAVGCAGGAGVPRSEWASALQRLGTAVLGQVLPFAIRPSKSDAKPHQNPRATIHRVQSTVAQTANPGSQLTPSPRALQKALLHSTRQAQRLAQAFGKVVPAEKRKPVLSTALTDHAHPSDR
jgi:hypothetical protein